MKSKNSEFPFLVGFSFLVFAVGMANAPGKRWETARKLTHYMPMSHNTIYLPNMAINAKECLDQKSILVRVIGVAREEGRVAEFVKEIWRPRGAYRVTRVNRQSFKIGFYSEVDFNRLKGIKWDYAGEDLIIARPWVANTNVAEDPLNSAPQRARIHNIPAAMWGDKAISRIASSLGRPIKAKTADPGHSLLPPPLEACVIVGKVFDYPTNIRIKTEDNEAKPGSDSIVSVDYVQRVLLCFRCVGFGHWPQQCRGENERRGNWNKYIATTPARTSIPATSRKQARQSQIQKAGANVVLADLIDVGAPD